MTGARTLHVLSAGAARALVLQLADEWRQTAAVTIAGAFDAAGAIRARFVAGAPCDVLILPAAMQDALGAKDLVDVASIASLGRVPTGIAVPEGEPAPTIADSDALRVALERASALYCPDTERSTAGIHFVRLLREMGIHDRVASKLRAYANGARAMAALAAGGRGAIGCTQVTEILYTPGVLLVGPLPAPFELTTAYTAAVGKAATDAALALQFVARLAARDTAPLRESSGFLRR